MIIKPKIRGFICTTAHPLGCARAVQEKIDFVKSRPPIQKGPERVLVIGASTGYGLASRIVAAFGCRAKTVGVFYEKPAEGKRTATAGWYNAVAFDKAARKEGLYTKSINGDAFSHQVKRETVDCIKRDLGHVDCVIYSLASPRRIHPDTGKICKSTLKPKGRYYTNKSIDFESDSIEEVTLQPATQEEIDQTVAVMGGEDWEMWMRALEDNQVLSEGIVTVAYSYIGPDITRPVYRQGTIGEAKDHLEHTAKKLDARVKRFNGRAVISVNKALVTQSSSAIPFIPLYYILLQKVMKEKGIDEGTIEQMYRLFRDKLYPDGGFRLDENGFIRLDDLELREDVQSEVEKRWSLVNDDNLRELSQLDGYKKDFLKLFGFGFDDIDYSLDVEHDLPLDCQS